LFDRLKQDLREPHAGFAAAHVDEQLQDSEHAATGLTDRRYSTTLLSAVLALARILLTRLALHGAGRAVVAMLGHRAATQ
jgi:hypothetical protein